MRAIELARHEIGGYDIAVRISPLTSLRNEARKDIAAATPPNVRVGPTSLPYEVRAATGAARQLTRFAPHRPIKTISELKDDPATLHRFLNRKRPRSDSNNNGIDLR